MPHTKSAEKRLRQNETRRLRNKATVKGIKRQTKEFLATLPGGDLAAKEASLALAAKKLDKAAARGVIHKNKAARLKSKLAKKLNATVLGTAAKPAGGKG